MTPEQSEIAIALQTCSVMPGSFDKRFIKNMNPDIVLTEKQNEWLYRLLFKYRRQIPDTYQKYSKNEFCKRK